MFEFSAFPLYAKSEVGLHKIGRKFEFSEMSQKRNTDDTSTSGHVDGIRNSDDKRRKSTPALVTSAVLEVMGQKSFQHVLEPMLRRVVKEEVESAIQTHIIKINRSSEENAIPSQTRSLKLKFLTTLNLPVFTGTRIEGEDNSSIKIALVDIQTNEIMLNSSESSSKVEIVVLEGDFDSEEREKWTSDEFKSNIVREREGKKPLLTGDVFVFLKKGVGCVGEISFSDNSSWTRSRRFRLGARIVGSGIKEGKTESFVVRDHRGELYKKHHPPSLFDEVWRLEKIGKDGAFHKRLSFERVKTVKDFLILLNLDPTRLRNILGTGMSTKMWDVTVEHARTCVLDKRIYLYYSLNYQHKNGVVFNVVGTILGLYSESQYASIDTLSETEKVDAIRMATEAFQHWDGVISFEDLNSLIGDSSNTTTTTTTSPMAIAPQNTTGLDFPQSSTPSHDIHSPLYSLDEFSIPPMESLGLAQVFDDDEHLGFMDIDFSSLHVANMEFESQADLESAYGVFLREESSSKREPARRRWKALSSVLRWFSVRKKIMMRKTHV